MKTIRILCCLMATAFVGGFASQAHAQGLVGFFVQPDWQGRGLVIGRFIPHTSAEELWWTRDQKGKVAISNPIWIRVKSE